MVADNNILISPSFESLKSVDDKGTFGGFLVKFGSVKEHDFERDFFDSDTDFWLNDGTGVTAVLYDHGKDKHIGKKRLDKNGGQLVVKDAGVWLETQLQRRNKYEEAVHHLAKQGKLGLSSGTASHLVQREVAGKNSQGEKVTHIKQWPLGLDASPTPEPAEPRTKVSPLEENESKSIHRFLEEKGKDVEEEQNTTVMGEEIKEVSYGDMIEMVRSDFGSAFPDRNGRVSDVYDDYVIFRSREDSKLYKVEYEGSIDGGYTFSNRGDWTEVVKERQIQERSEIEDTLDVLKDINKRLKSEHKYSSGDLVSWEGGDAQGRIRRQIGPNETVSPSTTDSTFSGDEDNPGYLIELVDKNEEGEVVGRGETVFHQEDTLSKISKSGVSSKQSEFSTQLNILEAKLNSLT